MQNKFSKFDIGSAKNKRSKNLKADLIVPLPPKLRKRKSLRQPANFALSCLVLVCLLQAASYLASAKNARGEILGAATSAYSNLSSAGKNLSQQNFAQASQLFESASTNVQLAQQKLNNFKALTWLTPQANSADHLLTGAAYLAQAGSKLTSALNLFDEFKIGSLGLELQDFDQKLLTNVQLLTETKNLVTKSSDEFNQVGSVPADYEDTLNTAKQQVSELALVLDKLVGLENIYLNVFGGQKTYLLIFQNNDEARATGGFIGTYGVLKSDHGKISKLKIESIYNLDGQIYEQIAAPGPFQPQIKKWGIRDANWFADFPTSAKKLLYFFEQGKETADGVISTTPKVFEDLLGLIGPIEMKDYGVTLTPENFQQMVQYKTSVDYDHQLNQPKQMLADFAPILMDRLAKLKKDQWFDFFQIMQNNLNQRQILIFSKDPEAQKNIDDLGFSGKILPADYDYLSIINSNLGGTKTDLKMQQTVRLQSKILSDGSILNTLTIVRKNNATQNNKDYLRVLVPDNSQFISAAGFNDYPLNLSTAEGKRTDADLANWDQGQIHSNIIVRKETGKAEFAGWLNTNPAEDKSVTLTYMLPFKVGSQHSLLLQKQSGSVPYNFEGSISLGKYSAAWLSSGVSKLDNMLDFNSYTNQDDFWGFVFNP